MILCCDSVYCRPKGAAEIVECVRKYEIYVDGISQNLQKLDFLLTRSFHDFFLHMEYGKQVKSSSQSISAKSILASQTIN